MRSSTVKVHIKTHPEAENPRVIKLDKSEISREEKKEEIKTQSFQVKKEKVEVPRAMDKMPSFQKPKEEIIKRHVENRQFKQSAAPPIFVPTAEIGEATMSRPLNSIPFKNMRKPYQLGAPALLSSFDNAFDAKNFRPHSFQKKICVSVPTVTALNSREGCLINKTQKIGLGRKSQYVNSALEKLNEKFQISPDKLF